MAKKMRIKIYPDKNQNIGDIEVKDGNGKIIIPVPHHGNAERVGIVYWSKNSPGCVNFVIFGQHYQV
jgi:hypothetical protein